MRTPLLLTIGLAVAPLGCSRAPSGPELSPDQFPKALISLETQVEAVNEAFDSGDPKAADRPLHMVGKTFSSIKRLAEPAGLSDQQQTSVEDATSVLFNAFADLHEPMHEKEFPADFDFEPIRQRLKDGLAQLRAALPAEIVKEMDDAAAERAAARPPRAPEQEVEAPAEAANPATDSPATDSPEADSAEPAATDSGAATPSAAARFVLASHRGKSSAVRAPIGPTVMMFDAASLELAPERVNRAADLTEPAPPGDRWVQFVPTLHARLRPDLTIEAYGQQLSRARSWSAAENYEVATDGLAERFRDAFAAAIGQAVSRGLNVALLPHLDPSGGPVSEWRNLYRFAPAEVIGAGSYESLLIDPLADAIEAAASSDTKIDLSLSGEMGRSLFEHPADYLALVRRLRDRFAANPRTAGVRIGVALNWDGLAGKLDPAAVDRDAVAELFAALDFVGFSCYAPVSVPPTSGDFVSATQTFLQQLSELGGELTPETRLVYAEAGIGGGSMRIGPDGPVYATAAEAAAKPYEGQGSNGARPWRDPALAALRRQYHAALCEYLQNGSETTPPIDKAFLWSEGPWDPQGVAFPQLRDEEIAAAIDEHNAG